MSIATEITRLQGAKADLKTAIENKGVTVSSSALLDAYPALVDSIPTGGAEDNALNFIDFDGKLVKTYSANEIAGLAALPDGPDHSTDNIPLTFDKWNWTLQQIKDYHTALPDAVINVGAVYHTTDGKIHLIYDITIDGTEVEFSLDSVGGTVDWGDGSAAESVSSGASSHTYALKGVYHCVVDSQTIQIKCGSINTTGDSNPKKYYSLTQVRLPSTITRIGHSFRSCSSLKNISIPDLTDINTTPQYSFYRCYALECVCISGVRIGGYNFEECYNLQRVSIPNNFEGGYGLGSNEFKNCWNLKSLTVPSATATLWGSFSGCRTLKSIVFPQGVADGGSSSFGDCGSLKYIKNIPISGNKKLPDSTLNGCFSLTELTLPSDLVSIGNYNSKVSSLKEITIPSTVTSIGTQLLYNSLSLTVVTVLATNPPTLGSQCFSSAKKIYVPYSSDHSVLDAYKAASNWSNFASIMEELPE